MELGAYGTEMERYGERERKPQGKGKGKGKKGKKNHGILAKYHSAGRVVRRLNLKKKEGRGWELAAVTAAVVVAPTLMVMGRKVITSNAGRGLTMFATGAAMQAPKSNSVAKAGKVMMVAGTVIALYDGLTALLRGPAPGGAQP